MSEHYHKHWLRQEDHYYRSWGIGRIRWSDVHCVHGCDYRHEAYGKQIPMEEIRLLEIEHRLEVLETSAAQESSAPSGPESPA